jgi:hypothetical protein
MLLCPGYHGPVGIYTLLASGLARIVELALSSQEVGEVATKGLAGGRRIQSGRRDISDPPPLQPIEMVGRSRCE